ncbi:MAG: 3D domain-containing protein [Prosthecobacter sp.]
MKIHILLCLTALCASAFADEETKSSATTPTGTPGQVIPGVRTTAYTHDESDHIEYGAKSAVGTQLKYGRICSAAADWSIYPVGTVFQIVGDSALYVVDDYGSALVGTKTIDLYKPSFSAMNKWGTRHVTIKVIKWGSFSKSLAILKPRATSAARASHVREMVSRIQANAGLASKAS